MPLVSSAIREHRARRSLDVAAQTYPASTPARCSIAQRPSTSTLTAGGPAGDLCLLVWLGDSYCPDLGGVRRFACLDDDTGGWACALTVDVLAEKREQPPEAGCRMGRGDGSRRGPDGLNRPRGLMVSSDSGGVIVPFASPTEVVDYIGQEDVAYVDVRFCDVPGVMQHFSVPARSFDADLIEGGLAFDGSSVRGFQSIHESDMLLLPDLGTAQLDPFRVAKTLNVNCFVHDHFTREAYSRDPRDVARKAQTTLRARASLTPPTLVLRPSSTSSTACNSTRRSTVASPPLGPLFAVFAVCAALVRWSSEPRIQVALLPSRRRANYVEIPFISSQIWCRGNRYIE
jgi:Glutamine synthetase, beta-Grasp domain